MNGETGHPSAIDPAAASARSWLSLAILCAVMMLSYIDRVLLAAVAEPLRREFGLSDTELGLLTGLSFGLFYAAMTLLLGRLADCRSRRSIIAWCLLAWSAVTALTGFARTYAELFVTRMAIGIGEAGSAPAANSLISDLFPPRQRSLAYGLFLGGAMLGPGLITTT